MRMGYGFANAPSHFSRVIHQAIMGVPNIFNYLGKIKKIINTKIFFLPFFFFSLVPLGRDELKQKKT